MMKVQDPATDYDLHENSITIDNEQNVSRNHLPAFKLKKAKKKNKTTNNTQRGTVNEYSGREFEQFVTQEHDWAMRQ